MQTQISDAKAARPPNPARIKKRLDQHARAVRKAYAGRLTRADALVFAYYVNCHKWALARGDESVHPGARRISWDLCLSRNQVKASRRKLIGLGLLRMVEAGGSLPGTPRRAMAVALGAAPASPLRGEPHTADDSLDDLIEAVEIRVGVDWANEDHAAAGLTLASFEAAGRAAIQTFLGAVEAGCAATGKPDEDLPIVELARLWREAQLAAIM